MIARNKSESQKQSIKEAWSKPEFRERMSAERSKLWSENPQRKLEQSQRFSNTLVKLNKDESFRASKTEKFRDNWEGKLKNSNIEDFKLKAGSIIDYKFTNSKSFKFLNKIRLTMFNTFIKLSGSNEISFYILKLGDLVKIGITKDIDRRWKDVSPEVIRIGNLDEMCILEYLVKLNFCLDNLEDGTEFAREEDYNQIIDFVTNFKFNDHKY